MNAGLGSLEGSPFRKRSTKIWYQIASLAHPGGSSNGAVKGHDWPSTSQVTQHVNRIADFLHTTDIVSLEHIHFACALAKRFCFDPHVLSTVTNRLHCDVPFLWVPYRPCLGPSPVRGMDLFMTTKRVRSVGKGILKNKPTFRRLAKRLLIKNTNKGRDREGSFTFHIT